MRRHTAMAALAVIAVALGCGRSSADKADRADKADKADKAGAGSVEAAITAELAEHGFAAQSIACPQPTARPGDAFECTARVDGIDVVVQVTGTGGAPDLRLGMISTALIRDKVAGDVRAEFGGDADVSCDGEYWLSKPGAVHQCSVTYEGKTRRAVIAIKDTAGNINYTLE